MSESLTQEGGDTPRTAEPAMLTTSGAPTVRVVRASEARIMPWKNGGGSTLEIAREPEGTEDYDWRASVATVASSGPFSSFPGKDRTIVQLSGSPLALIHAATPRLPARRVVLIQDVPHPFSGDDATAGEMTGAGSARDFNVIVDRTRFAATVYPQRGPFSLRLDKGDRLIVYLEEGSLPLLGHELQAGDTLIAAAPHAWMAEAFPDAPARFLVIVLTASHTI